MEIKYKNIVMRDMIESDIEDWIRWDSIDTEWMNWDAPDEPIEPIDPVEYREDLLEFVNTPRQDEFRSFFELATAEGLHIGRINSYTLDANLEFHPWPDTFDADTITACIGIDICNSKVWGLGYGTQAIAALIRHFLEHGIHEICLQTWSGNFRMIRVAEKLGFAECNRIIGNRLIRGDVYDSLTFKLDLDRFHNYLHSNS